MSEHLKEALARRMKPGFATHFEALDKDNVDAPEHVAAMTQPPDQPEFHDPMKETGPGYETEKTTTLQKEEGLPVMKAENGKESEEEMAKIYELLGSENAGGLRGRAVKMAKEKEDKNG